MTLVPYNPHDAEGGGERREYPVLEAGEYPAVLTAAENKGTTIILTYEVFNSGGNSLILKDWMNLSLGVCVHRFKQMARATGNIPQFDAGAFDVSTVIGSNFTVMVSKKKSKDGVGFRNWIDAVTVSDTPPQTAPATERPRLYSGTPPTADPREAGTPPTAAHKAVTDDDIPF